MRHFVIEKHWHIKLLTFLKKIQKKIKIKKSKKKKKDQEEDLLFSS